MNNSTVFNKFLPIQRNTRICNVKSESKETCCRTPLSIASSLMILSYRRFSCTKTTFCEEWSPPRLEQERKQCIIPGDNDIRQREEISCSACKYTGMLVCMSLSLYFAKLATDDTAGVVKQSTKITKNHKPFFCVCSAGWAVAGVYRWYLG